MPTNLPAEAKKKWDEASSARNPKRKLRHLQEFLSLIPKHKGTEKLRAQVKTKMANLRREMEEKKQKKVGTRSSKFSIEKDGAAQVVILGGTNVGRSSLLKAITNAKVEISGYPFTTIEPIPGMLNFEDIQFQIIEAPALTRDLSESKGVGHQTLVLARNSDGLILMVDLSMDPKEQICILYDELEKSRILVRKPSARVEINRVSIGIGLRIFVIGKLMDCTLKEVESLLRSYRIHNAIVKVHGNASLDDVEDSIFESAVFRPTIIVANKLDVNGGKEKLEELQREVGENLTLVPVSCKTGIGLERLGKELFNSLGIMRIYTKQPSSKETSKTPFILKRGSTIADLAKHIHSDFFERFSYAKVWSLRLPFSPQKVGASFVLDDKDIVEMHLR